MQCESAQDCHGGPLHVNQKIYKEKKRAAKQPTISTFFQPVAIMVTELFAQFGAVDAKLFNKQRALVAVGNYRIKVSDSGSSSSPVSTESLAHKDILPSGNSAGCLKSFSVSSEIVKPQEETVVESEISVVPRRNPKTLVIKEDITKADVIWAMQALNKVIQSGQMDIVIRFWDKENHKAVSCYLNSVFFDKSTAEELKHFLDGISPLPHSKLIQVSLDGPNELNHANTINDALAKNAKNTCIFATSKNLSFKKYFILVISLVMKAREALHKFKDHRDLEVKLYSTLYHSPVARTLLWGGLTLSAVGCVAALVINTQPKSINEIIYTVAEALRKEYNNHNFQGYLNSLKSEHQLLVLFSAVPQRR
uniref:Uncharacterized protein n=1 Tax=Timema monikensis TaxID=170555 RepID=A0A7R9E929_9NEOP|nr:unnamed protein product [Timema monikensis]